jgi:hypothetical protein
VFALASALLLAYCLTARRRRLSTLAIGSMMLATYFAIGFGFVDPHWVEAK